MPKRRGHGEGYFIKLPSGNYQYKGHKDGETFSGTQPSLALAKEAHRQHMSAPKAAPGSDKPLDVLVEEYITFRVRSVKHWDDGAWRRNYKRYWSAIVGQLLPAQVTSSMIYNRVEELRTSNGFGRKDEGLAPQSGRNALSNIKAAFSWFRKKGYVDKNPGEEANDLLKDLLKTDYDENSFRYLRDPRDVARVIDALPDVYAVAFAIGTYAGLRSGEILALDWTNINLASKNIRITCQINQAKKKPPKDKTPRNTRMWPQLVPILEYWRWKTGGQGMLFRPQITQKGTVTVSLHNSNYWACCWKGEDGIRYYKGGFESQEAAKRYVANEIAKLQVTITPRNQNRYMTSKALDDAFGIVAEKLGIDGEVRFYDATRHTFAAQSLRMGQDLWQIARCLGHSDENVTQKYYAQLQVSDIDDEGARDPNDLPWPDMERFKVPSTTVQVPVYRAEVAPRLGREETRLELPETLPRPLIRSS